MSQLLNDQGSEERSRRRHLIKLRVKVRVKKELDRRFLVGCWGFFDVIHHEHIKGESTLLQPQAQFRFHYS